MTKHGRGAKKKWTAKAIVASFRRFEHAMGRPPSTNDIYPGTPSRRARMTPERLAELDRVRKLGLRLPEVRAAVREFGSWPLALEAAGMEPCGNTMRAEIRKTGCWCKGMEVCPSCGNFQWVLDEETGWCSSCTADLHRNEPVAA